jgi:hypothetical protein
VQSMFFRITVRRKKRPEPYHDSDVADGLGADGKMSNTLPGKYSVTGTLHVFHMRTCQNPGRKKQSRRRDDGDRGPIGGNSVSWGQYPLPGLIL